MEINLKIWTRFLVVLRLWVFRPYTAPSDWPVISLGLPYCPVLGLRIYILYPPPPFVQCPFCLVE